MTERHIIRGGRTDDREVFEYALLRVVPRIERGEAINAGVLVYCRAKAYVGVRTHLDEARLRALDPDLGLGEPDERVQELLKSSGGTNLGMDFLSGALGFDPLAFPVGPEEAGRIVWFDALVNNVDRSWRNPNLLWWRREVWLIDHGATMIWQHNWPGAEKSAARPYDASDHVLKPFAPDVAAAAAELAPRVTEDLLAEVTAEIPDAWLADEPGFESPDELRRTYARPLLARAAVVHERIEGIA